jgi:VWA domain-containing protein
VVVRILSLVLVLLLSGAGVAVAAPTDLDDLYGELGIADVATDYVVLVDTSGSMADNGRYDDVRDSLRTFFAGLRPVDHVTLITFAESTDVVHDGPADKAADAIDDMPDTPVSDYTDLGTAIDLGFSSLERSGHAPLGAVVLLTDGLDNPPPDSRYDDEDAWAELADRGKRLAGHVSGYTLPLKTDESGTDVLGDLLPTVVLRMTSAESLSAFLGRLADDVRREAAKDLVKPDLDAAIEVEWVPPPAGADLSTPVEWTVRVNSRAAHLPLEVTGLRVEVTGFEPKIGGLPARLTLAPDERVELKVSVGAVQTSEMRLREIRPVDTRLRLVGTVDSPWRTVVERDLELEFAPRPLDGAVAWKGTTTVGYPVLIVAGAGLVIVLLITTPGFVWSRRHPKMRGTLFATAAGGQPLRIDLRGRRRLRFPRPQTPLSPGMSGEFTLRGGTGPDRGSLRIDYRSRGDGQNKQQLCAPDTEREIYGITMRYHRRR